MPQDHNTSVSQQSVQRVLMDHREVRELEIREQELRGRTIRMNTYLIVLVTILSLFAFILWPPIQDILKARHHIMLAELEGYRKIPNLEATIAIIEKQLTALTTENIEGRLVRIEKAIKVGEVNTEELKSLQELRNDFNFMKSFMFSKPDQLVDFKTLHRDYQQLVAASNTTMTKDNILREIDSVRNLFYATSTIFGILISIFGGAWFIVIRQRLKPSQVESAQQEAPTNT